MKNVLVITSSLNQQDGNSTKLVREYIDGLAASEAVKVNTRDLAASPLPHLSAEEMGAWMTPAEQRNEEQASLASLSDTLIEELSHADEIVLGVPMYNFGIPSTLKAWIDRIARAGVTFRYTENGPVGLIEGKTVRIFAARGGQYEGTEFDTQSSYLKHFFGFIGISDVKFVYAEGLNLGDEPKENSFKQASKKIIELIAQ